MIVNETLDWQERGLHYGDGLFETLLKFRGEIPLWKDHYRRLYKGCQRLRIALPKEAWLLEKIARETGEMESAIVKIIVTRGNGGRGLKLPANNYPSLFVFKYPWSEITESELALEVEVCETRLPINPNLAGIKHLNRLDYVLAALELESKGQKNEGILCDTEGYLVEGIISNLFFCLQDQVYTPSLELAGVAGIMRRKILSYFKSQGINVEVGRFSTELLMQSSECFMCNSVQGVRPIRSIGQHRFDLGPLTRDLMEIFNSRRKLEF